MVRWEMVGRRWEMEDGGLGFGFTGMSNFALPSPIPSQASGFNFAPF